MHHTFHIKDSSNPKVKAFLEYIKSLDFVHVESDDKDKAEEIKISLKQSFKELKLMKEGKIKATPAKDL
ncbi:hypothetical protein [Brumimicrobium aurantiacum]|nr:hypothetical protein [Brumimicrobium aurantiacum]